MNALAFETPEGSLTVRPRRAVVAAFTGRDAASTAAHVAELEEIGVPRPETVPDFYTVDSGLLTTEREVIVAGSSTSGEVEPLLVVANGEWYVGVASDHTDRSLERRSIEAGKRACPKVLSPNVVPFEELQDDWDDLILVSYVDDEDRPYQRAELRELQPPGLIVQECRARLDIDDLDGTVLLLGTVPVLDQQLRYGEWFAAELRSPTGAPIASCRYHIRIDPHPAEEVSSL